MIRAKFLIVGLVGGALVMIVDFGLRQIAVPPVLEFQGAPSVSPMTEGKVSITYLARRNESCQTSVHIRWYDQDRRGFDLGSARTVEAVRAPVTTDFEPFTITIPVPPGIRRPVYAPMLEPGADCRSRDHIVVPLAEVRR